MGFMFMGLLTSVPKLFPPEKISIVTGIYQTSSGVAMLVFAPLATYLIQEYGLVKQADPVGTLAVALICGKHICIKNYNMGK